MENRTRSDFTKGFLRIFLKKTLRPLCCNFRETQRANASGIFPDIVYGKDASSIFNTRVRVRRARCERGATSVEVAGSVMVFFLIILGGMEVMRFAYITLATQVVAISSTRFLSIGACTGVSCSTAAGRAESVEAQMIEYAKVLSVTLTDSNVCIRPGSSPICNPGNTNDDAGPPREVVFVRISVNVPLLFGFGQYQVNAEALAKNEPFGPALI